LQTEGLVCGIRYPSFLFQTIPGGVVAVPQQIAVDAGHLFRYADLVAVEVVSLLSVFGIGAVVYRCQWFAGILGGTDIGIVAFVGVLLK